MKKQGKRKMVRRAFTIFADQDARLAKLADEFPDMDKSRILRYLLAGSLGSLERRGIMRAVLDGTVSTWEKHQKEELERILAESGNEPF